MSERSEYQRGEFCWVDLASPDLEASVKFYGDLMGWKAEAAVSSEETGGYGFFTFKGKQVAGYGPIPKDQPPAWSSYIKVEDADETLGKVKEAGGNVVFGPVDLPNESGRMGVCQDAAGAYFSIMEQNQHRGAELVNEVGSWTWNQLATRDLDGAKKFYGAVFGWDIQKASDEAGAEPFSMWQVEGQKWEEGLAGAMLMGDEIEGVPPHWQVYFCVDDAKAAIEKVDGSGGQTLFGPQRIPVGELAVFNDPQGAGFAIIEPDYPEAR